MVTAVRADVPEALNTLSVNRPVGGGKPVASAAEPESPTTSNGAVTAAYVLSSGPASNPQPDDQQQETPSFAGRFRKAVGSFAAAYDVRLISEVADEPRLMSIPAPQSFSGLVVRAVNLYESTGIVSTGSAPRGTSLNALS